MSSLFDANLPLPRRAVKKSVKIFNSVCTAL
nr:MAG TPA: hypothetical protein [Caudoviricetes sp.]